MASQPSGLCNIEAIPVEENSWYDLIHGWKDKGINTFPKCIFPKVKVIVRLEFELACYDLTVLYVSHYAPHIITCLIK